jgi:hypothetical protein
MNRFKQFLMAAAFCAASVQATAANTDWDSHGAAEFGFGVTAPGIVIDSFEFSLAEGSTLSTTAVSNNLSPVFGFSSGLVQLFKVQSGPDTLVGFFGFDGTTGSSPYTFASLVAGEYFYLVSGLANGTAGAIYTLTSTVSMVPESGAGLLFGVGLLGLALVSRRRMHAQD